MSAVDEAAGKRDSRTSRGFSVLLPRPAERYVVVAALLAVIVLFAVTKPAAFLSAGTIESVLATQSVLLIVALSLTVVLAASGLDLSIGGDIGFTAVIVAQLASSGGFRM